IRRTAYNKKITYCAVAAEGGAGAYIVEGLDGRDYVTQGAPSGLASSTLDMMRDLNVVAYLLAPAPNNEDGMRCEDVALASGGTFNLTATGGFATPVFGVYGSGEGGAGEQTFNAVSEEDFLNAL